MIKVVSEIHGHYADEIPDVKTVSNTVISPLQSAIVDTPLVFIMSSIHITLY